MIRFLLIGLLATVLSQLSGATEGHEPDHKHEMEHDEETDSVGPDKGIVEVDKQNGFKLSQEAFKNFDLKFQKLSGGGPWAVARSAIVHSGEEVNIFRLRSGFFKRIDFRTVRKSEAEIVVSSGDLREGDEVVLAGLGFLRIAELAASGGTAHGHSH